jgi:hypothetical protein
MNEFFNIGLPKWPALIVKGKKVTEDQAKEIIIRTDDFYFSSNDHEFSKQLYEFIYNVKGEGSMAHCSLHDCFKKEDGTNDWDKANEAERKIRNDLKLLDLSYLHNSQIVSSWIGGPHGWCNWNGYIGTNNYNIGKWPSVEEVYNDWVKIAQAFPFLDLRSQLLSGETGEDNSYPLIEYIIKDGKVEMTKTEEILDYPNFNIEASCMNIVFNMKRERGCTIESFKEAFKFVKVKCSK